MKNKSASELNKKWDIHNVVQSAIESAHNTPAPETKERLIALEITLKETQKTYMDKFNEFQSDNKEAHQALVEIIKGIEIKIDKALEGKANKWVEKAFSYILYTTGGILITSLIYLVIKK